MPVGELLARVSARELAEWQAFEMVYGPIGPVRDDILAALVSAHVVGALTTSKTRRPKLADFLPQWGVMREEVDRGHDQESPHPARGGNRPS